jgi:FtsP/CotA-like multicopper oxidase with cupredoxin domain
VFLYVLRVFNPTFSHRGTGVDKQAERIFGEGGGKGHSENSTKAGKMFKSQEKRENIFLRSHMKRTRIVTVATGLLAVALLIAVGLQGRKAEAQTAGQTPFPGKNIPQFVQPLPLLGETGFEVLGGTSLTISMEEFDAKILPPGTFVVGQQPLTRVWGYTSSTNPVVGSRETYLGPVIVATRGVPTQVTWVNNLGHTSTTRLTFWKNSTDQTLHWADPLNKEFNQGAMDSIMNPGQPPASPWNQNYSGPIPAAVHLHGGEVPPQLDGGPDA